MDAHARLGPLLTETSRPPGFGSAGNTAEAFPGRDPETLVQELRLRATESKKGQKAQLLFGGELSRDFSQGWARPIKGRGRAQKLWKCMKLIFLR